MKFTGQQTKGVKNMNLKMKLDAIRQMQEKNHAVDQSFCTGYKAGLEANFTIEQWKLIRTVMLYFQNNCNSNQYPEVDDEITKIIFRINQIEDLMKEGD